MMQERIAGNTNNSNDGGYKNIEWNLTQRTSVYIDPTREMVNW